LETIPIYYRLAPRRNIAPEVLVAQSIVETGRGYYGGANLSWFAPRKNCARSRCPELETGRIFVRPCTTPGNIASKISSIVSS
jgi:hypothetical protein